MDFKDPQVQKGIIVGILCIMIGYVYFFTSFMPFFHHPMRAKIASLSSEYEKMSAELEKARKTVGNLANWRPSITGSTTNGSPPRGSFPRIKRSPTFFGR